MIRNNIILEKIYQTNGYYRRELPNLKLIFVRLYYEFIIMIYNFNKLYNIEQSKDFLENDL